MTKLFIFSMGVEELDSKFFNPWNRALYSYYPTSWNPAGQYFLPDTNTMNDLWAAIAEIVGNNAIEEITISAPLRDSFAMSDAWTVVIAGELAAAKMRLHYPTSTFVTKNVWIRVATLRRALKRLFEKRLRRPQFSR